MKSKFASISDTIIEMIESGQLLPGDKIPSENELIKQYKISNTTARKSLLDIESRGYAKRIKGKGTFVLNRTANHQLTRVLGSINSTRKGFDESLRAEGFLPKNIILEKTILNEGISANVLGGNYIIEGPVLKIHQLRFADDLVVKDEIRYISLTLCPNIHKHSPEVAFYSLYENEYNLEISDIKQTLGVEIITSESALSNFNVDQPIPVFELDSVIFSTHSKVIEIEHSLYRGGSYKFAIFTHPDHNTVINSNFIR
ncbi:MAG: GntR family transcriptional regulator [Pedobacter sp.]|nr:MAG: GntR family transcriptional regulator [Pedobacter sp.]